MTLQINLNENNAAVKEYKSDLNNSSNQHNPFIKECNTETKKAGVIKAIVNVR